MRVLLLLCLLLLSYNSEAQQKPKVKPIPDWVTPVDIDLDMAIDTANVSGGEFFMLSDQQVHVGAEQSYVHWISNVINQSGLQDASKISIDYDPIYEKVVLHHVNILRDGEKLDQLSSNAILVLQREEDYARSIYDGSLTIVIELKGVRVGDIIDVSFSSIGFNPVYDNKFTRGVSLQFSVPLGHIYDRVIMPRGRTLNTRALNSELTPEIIDGPQGIEYVAKLTNLKALRFDDRLPGWYDPFPSFQYSEYDSWDDVRLWGVNLFKKARADSREVERFAQQIDRTVEAKEDKIAKVMSFVQDEIRYLGFEGGINGFMPHPSDDVLEQRYGDCKDKSLLAVEMLNTIGIEAYPALVSTHKTRGLSKRIPTPKAFNHCIVFIPHKSGDQWFDPTISNQGGVDKRFVPNYGEELVLRDEGPVFESFAHQATDIIAIDEIFIVPEKTGPAEVEIITKYHGKYADDIRNYFESTSLNSISQIYTDYQATNYGDVTATNDITTKDDKKSNVFTTIESYHIDDFWYVSDSIGGLKYEAFLYPQMIRDYLFDIDNPNRTLPLALGGKVHIIENITVNMPEEWNVEIEATDLRAPGVHYSFSFKSDYNVLRARYEYFQDRNWVEASDASALYALNDKVIADLGFTVNYRDPDSLKGTTLGHFFGIFTFLLCAAISIFLGIKLWNYNPPNYLDTDLVDSAPIGGWMILPTIGLVLTPFMILIQLFIGPENSYLVLLLAFLPDTPEITPSLTALLFLEYIFNIFFLFYSTILVFLFFKKRSSVPLLMAIFYTYSLVIIVADTAAAYAVVDGTNLEDSGMDILKRVFQAMIWIPFFLISKRVKETFVVRL